MPSFGKTSRQRLATCHQDLQTIFNYVIKEFDCSVICGHRGRIAQNEAFKKGYSKVQFPDSKHNKIPSMAVDVVPYPIDWQDTDRMKYFAGFVMGTAKMLQSYGAISHGLRWGGDWNQNTLLSDNTFQDFPHFELI